MTHPETRLWAYQHAEQRMTRSIAHRLLAWLRSFHPFADPATRTIALSGCVLRGRMEIGSAVIVDTSAGPIVLEDGASIRGSFQ